MMSLPRELRAAQREADYQKTLALLRALKAGEVTLDQVQMNDDGWGIVIPPPGMVVEPGKPADPEPEQPKAAEPEQKPAGSEQTASSEPATVAAA